MRILITGGAGFIGSAVIRYLLAETSAEVINYDKLSYAANLNSLNGAAESSRYTFVHGDVCDAAAIKHTLQEHRPNAIMHLAAESHVDRSIEGPDVFIETNIVGTYTLLKETTSYLDTLPEEKTDAFRFHHISTDEVFGDLEEHEPRFTESTPYQPSSPYAATKAGSDHLVRAWSRTYGLPVLITNCSNNYGPYQFPEKLIPHMILNALSSQPLPIYGSGQQIRDWLFVEDHARALWRVLNMGNPGETYNIGGNSEFTNKEVVLRLCSCLRDLQESDIEYEDLITHVEDRPGHDKRYAIDSSKMQNQLNWSPSVDFDQGLRSTVAWYLQNREWWQAILDGSYRLTRIGLT